MVMMMMIMVMMMMILSLLWLLLQESKPVCVCDHLRKRLTAVFCLDLPDNKSLFDLPACSLCVPVHKTDKYLQSPPSTATPDWQIPPITVLRTSARHRERRRSLSFQFTCTSVCFQVCDSHCDQTTSELNTSNCRMFHEVMTWIRDGMNPERATLAHRRKIRVKSTAKN